MPKKPISLPVEEIEATAGTQVRVRLSPDTIDEYAEDMKNGAIFPPIIVFAEEGSERYILADGFHRVAAAKQAKKPVLDCQILPGGIPEAVDYALSANSQNGMRRTAADKRHAVLMALKDPRHKDRTLREIAELCRVGKSTVGDIKRELTEKDRREKLSGPDKGPADKEPASGAGRETRPAPSQGDVDRDSLLGACAVIRGFPYTGYDAIEKMGLTADDHGHILNEAADWLDGAAAPLGNDDE